jgi:DeoR/GlpR family transcriptional regulator of sugar metabolism
LRSITSLYQLALVFHSKLGIVALAKLAPLPLVDVLVTDGAADAEMLREAELAGVRVVAEPRA